MKLVRNIPHFYSINGSLRKRETTQPQQNTEYYLFNSQGNLKAYSDDIMGFAYYGYNAANTRTYKLSLYNTNLWINGQQQPLHLQLQQAMFYPNTYINFNQNGEYTKHYYNGMERIASRLGDNNTTIAIDNMLENRKVSLEEQVRNDIQELISEPTQVDMPPMLDILNLQPTGTPNDIYYYHPNHLGSTSFVTDQNQNITQGFLYAPFGEITTEYNINFGNNVIPKYSFNAKELDEETGMFYYEARYYAPPVFTSRDVMFEKYFWMSPYAYCANNPVKYVDPSGNTVVITGEDCTTAFNSLQQGTNLILSINDEGVLSCSDDILNENDQMLYDAITSSDVTVNIEAYSESTTKSTYEEYTFNLSAGCYMGSDYDPNSNKASSTNYVRMDLLSKYEKYGAEGSGMMHEISEGYLLGLKSIDMKNSIKPAIKQNIENNIGIGRYEQTINYGKPIFPTDYNIYMDYGHTKATKAPNEMTRKQAKSYKTLTIIKNPLNYIFL